MRMKVSNLESSQEYIKDDNDLEDLEKLESLEKEDKARKSCTLQLKINELP